MPDPILRELALPARVPASRAPARFPLARLAAWSLPVCVAFALLEAWQGRVLYPDVALGDFWRVALWRTLPPWLTLSLFVPLVPGWILLWHERRPEAWHWIPIHALGGLAFVFAHLGLSAAIVGWTPVPRSIAQEFRHLVGGYLTSELFTYFALAGFVHVVLALTDARDAERDALELRAGLERAELAQLREQLDPHLLFNALNAVLGLAERRDFEGVRHSIERLAARAREEVPLADELEFAADYLALHQLRFGDRLQVEFDVGPGAREARVPSLILQPLVENAIRHGLSGGPQGDRIRVVAERTATALRLRVEDTGPGFGVRGDTSGGFGIGLQNTVRRLERLYGERHRIGVGNRESGGSFVEIEIPLESP